MTGRKDNGADGVYVATDPVRDADSLFAGRRRAYPDQQTKVLDYIDDLAAQWIAASPFLTMATVDAAGQIDVSPKGDPPGFVKVISPRTLAVPDRPGNHRYDGFQNIFDTGRAGLVFLVPNRNEVLRVNGAAEVVRDHKVRERLQIKGRIPDFAVLVHVEEAFFHCGKAIIRSALWQPDRAADVSHLPSYAEALAAQAEVSGDFAALEERLRHNDTHRLYDE